MPKTRTERAQLNHSNQPGSTQPGGIDAPAARVELTGGDAPPANFEAALAELETIVASMEAGELPLEGSLTAYKRGAALLQYCQSALKDAQQQVKVLEAGVLQDLPGADDIG
jgi:exodeoxyribonuclease VII small subunit